MNTFLTILSILSLILVFFAGLLIGKHIQKNLDECKNCYDSGWNDCMNYYQQHYELTSIDEMLDTLSKELDKN